MASHAAKAARCSFRGYRVDTHLMHGKLVLPCISWEPDPADHHWSRAMQATIFSIGRSNERGFPMLKQIRHFIGALRPVSVEEREHAYLSAASDRYDLEYRQRQVERGMFRRAF